MKLGPNPLRRRLQYGVVSVFVATVALVLGAIPVAAWGNPSYLGLISATSPQSPPFVVSPDYYDLSAGPATVTFSFQVTNLTNARQSIPVRLGVHRILTYMGQDVSDGQPGQPGITFGRGTFALTTQQLVGTPQTQRVILAPGASNQTVTFTVQLSQCGYFQFDAGAPKGTLSLGFTRALNCQGQRLTPGYWKNHASATTSLLPQWLGGYDVANFSEADSVFGAMNCSNNDGAAVNCLAAHLLAADLDLASGSATCISGVVTQANAFLKTVSYDGPTTYSISSSQRATAVALADALDSYTNDGTGLTC